MEIIDSISILWDSHQNLFFYIAICEPGEVSCQGRCIEKSRVCDGYPDCSDYADEVNCPKPDECPEDMCADGTCILSRQRCDGRTDCPSGEDEHGCRKLNLHITTHFLSSYYNAHKSLIHSQNFFISLKNLNALSFKLIQSKYFL